MIFGGSVEEGPTRGVNIVEPLQKNWKDGIVVARAIIDTNNGGCSVRLLNSTKSVIKSKKGDVIASLEATDEFPVQQPDG